jgi:hypothetical protein
MTIKIGTNNAKIHEVNQKQTNDFLTGRLLNQHNLYNESHGLVSRWWGEEGDRNYSRDSGD